MTRLTELRAVVQGPYNDGTHELWLLCPTCRRHGIFVRFWDKPALPATADKAAIRQVVGKPHIETLTLQPEVDTTILRPSPPCGGWRGNIRNGDAR